MTVAADGGWRLLERLNIPCHSLVGDFDTLDAREVSKAQEQGSHIKRFSSDKCQSDLELAIDEAAQLGAKKITIIGALGGEWDHCITNLLAPLSLCSERKIWARLLTDTAEIYLISEAVEVNALGRRVSLASVSSITESLSLIGFEYPLQQTNLRRSQTLCLANQINQEQARITFARGELLITVIPSQ